MPVQKKIRVTAIEYSSGFEKPGEKNYNYLFRLQNFCLTGNSPK